MRGMTCAVCGAGFTARSDALYCSSACRQKAHRARSARRAAALREIVRRSFPASRSTHSDAGRSLQLAAATSVRRAREQVDRSRELCRAAALRLEQSDAVREQVSKQWAARSAPGTGRASWPGN
ncbi:hypothetical protein HMPREF0591_3726 [Mycobacterium parascrofulaceum ATCC BAA-614]|uniref:Uncharacterized protein n=1 Tax=Mycobacterium parascrofulaceum ATCC BAA-614 TaxID=525368 RepID=D5PC32_9MYCO|nr:hypothetical protein [Mycobacterium malmoense]EFG76361.1 hypothetical protein HMPREF0591_3726 [Mycobacterium parascrofulaceum ATCC BAA-614]OCB50244.1 hypothetical protein A9X02_12120 [Mycobacterium malmoense]